MLEAQTFDYVVKMKLERYSVSILPATSRP